MDPGPHTIEVAAYLNQEVRLEGPRSIPITVRLETATEATSAAATDTRLESSPSSVRLRATEVATGLDDPTDLAALPDGRVLVAERSGRVRVFRNGALAPQPALLLPDVATGDGKGLLALAVDLDFEKTQAVFALYTTAAGVRVSRFSATGDTLGAQAIILEGLPVATAGPHAAMRMGPDRKLYLALDDGGDGDRAGDAGTLSGKVLRLSADGTTPVDQPPGPPVYVAGVHHPTGLAWTADPPTLWVTDRSAAGVEQIHVARGPAAAGRGAVALRFALPPAMGATAIVVSDPTSIPALRGSLLVAADTAQAILRIALDPSGGIVATEWLVRDEVGPIRALAVGADGAIYACTPHALVRLDTRGR